MIVVITDAGEAYGCGFDRGRGYWTHLDHCKSRQAPYKIEIKDCVKALRCWTLKNTSNFYITGEDASGNRHTYSGSEFLDHYESNMYNAYGREFRQNYGSCDNRKPAEKMGLPDGVYLKKVGGCSGGHVWGLDQNNNVYKWGYQMRDYSNSQLD